MVAVLFGVPGASGIAISPYADPVATLFASQARILAIVVHLRKMVDIHLEGKVACSAELLLDEETRTSRYGQRLVNILNLYHRREQAAILRKILAIDELLEARVQLCSPRVRNRIEHVLEKRVGDAVD